MQELTRGRGGRTSRNHAASPLPLLLLFLLLLLLLLLPASLVIRAQQLTRLLHSMPIGSCRKQAGADQSVHAAAPRGPGAAARRCRCIFLGHQHWPRLPRSPAEAQRWQWGGRLGKGGGLRIC